MTATIAGCAVEQTWGLQSYKGTILTHSTQKLRMRSSKPETAMKRMCQTLGGILFRMLQESEERSKTTSVYFVPMPISLQLCYLLADSHHRPMNWRCRFCNSRPGLMPNHPGAEPRLDKQYQGPRQDQLVILQWNSDGILREVTALKMVHDMQQADMT